MRKREQTMAILGDLVAFPTVSADSNLAMIGYLADRLEDAGARVDVLHDPSGQKANLFATLGPGSDGGIVLSGHSDVVPVSDQTWTCDPFGMTRRDGRLFGRGTCDMKGFIAVCVAMAPVLARRVRHRPVHFAFTYDEEVGCIGARALVDSLRAKGIKPGVAIIGEPTAMRIIEGHKGCCEYTTRFQGLAGHGADPESGVNAVEFAVRFVSRLLELRAELRARAPANSRFSPPWTTLNTGRLSGGVAHNVIAARASVEWEMRPVREQDAVFVRDTMHRYVSDTLLPAMRGVWPEASVVTEVIGEVAGLIPTDANEARAILMALSGETDADVVSFGTEAGLFQAMGLDVVVCGPGSIEQAHRPDEFIDIAQLDACLAFVDRLGHSLSD